MDVITEIADFLKKIIPAAQKSGMNMQQILKWVCVIADVLSKDVCPTIQEPPKSRFGKGWVRQKPDHRDLMLSRPIIAAKDLPEEVDPRVSSPETMPSIYDQGQIGSCGPNVGAAFTENLCLKQKYPWKFTPSRLFLYYNIRLTMGTVLMDSGVTIRDIFKSLNATGICPEVEGDGTHPKWLWPYSDGPVKFRLQPKHECYEDAKLHGALQYEAVPQTIDAMKTVLADGFWVAIGIDVYESFEGDAAVKSGVIPMPNTATEQLLGGHALAVVGYLPTAKVVEYLLGRYLPVLENMDKDGYFIVRNSWGTSYGDQGYCYIPFAYLVDTSLSSDFWTCKLIGNIAKAA